MSYKYKSIIAVAGVLLAMAIISSRGQTTQEVPATQSATVFEVAAPQVDCTTENEYNLQKSGEVSGRGDATFSKNANDFHFLMMSYNTTARKSDKLVIAIGALEEGISLETWRSTLQMIRDGTDGWPGTVVVEVRGLPADQAAILCNTPTSRPAPSTRPWPRSEYPDGNAEFTN